MLPFKTSSVYKIEPRRDFMVTQRSVARDQPKRASEFYDIGNALRHFKTIIPL